MNGQKPNESKAFDLQAALSQYKQVNTWFEVCEQAAADGNPQQKALAEMAYNMKLQFLHDTAEEIAGLHPDLTAERERLEALHGGGEALLAKEKVFLQMVVTAVRLYNGLPGSAAGAAEDVIIAGLPEEIRSEIESKLKNVSDSGQAFINDSPVVKTIMRPEAESRRREEITLSSKAEAVFTLVEGWADPFEVAMIEEIGKFGFIEGQRTANGKIFCTRGQLYRALRGGRDQSPTKAQGESLIQDLQRLSDNGRKLTFKLNDYAKIWGGFETNGGKIRMLSFDEFYGKIKGQEDILLVFDETIILHAMAENLKMYEIIPQKVKDIQERRYILTLANGETIEGNARKVKQEIKKKGVCAADIVAEEIGGYQNMKLTRPRIAIRTQLLKFIMSYTRARTMNKPHSNKLPYKTIFQNCNINENSRETVKRTIEDIKEMLHYFQITAIDTEEGRTAITGWREYTNRGSKKPDGIEISIASAISEGVM